MTKIFISYAREDLSSAERLYESLSASGFLPWLDKRDLLPGQEWEVSLRSAIESCDYFIALLSNISVGKRGYVQKEVRKAMEILDELPEGKIFLIPARIEECVPSHNKLKKFHWVDLYPDWEKGIKELQLSLRVSATLPEQMITKKNPANQVESTVTFSKEDLTRLEHMKESLDLSSIAQALSMSLKLSDLISAEQKEGKSILLEDNDGQMLKLVIPQSS